MLNYFKLLFSPHQQLSKLQIKTVISTFHKYSVLKSPLQPQVFWDIMRQALKIIWQLSAIFLLTYLALSGWMRADAHFQVSPKMFDEFKSRFWLGHSRTFKELTISHSCCVLGVIVMLKGKASGQSEFLNALVCVLIKAISIF